MLWHTENAVAGIVAGFVTTTALHPLDVVRTRFQVQDGHDAVVPKYRNTANALLSIARIEGLRGLYAGLFPAVLGSSISWGLYFYLYNTTKSWNRRWRGEDLGAGLHLISATEAGALVCLVTNPVWLAKTRLQLQGPGLGVHKPYAGFADSLQRIVKEEGWWALYKGLGPSLILVSHASLQFMAYEEGRKLALDLRRFYHSGDKKEDVCLKPSDFAILGGLSKVFATLVTYPYQVIRTRIQQRPLRDGRVKYTGIWHTSAEILKHEGATGFYKGIVPSLLKNVPASSITFLVYEMVLKLLQKQ
ncbi:hypothetical protein KP509_03G088700 [Ceratopteris richardii]|uniref:Folate transporter 1, chloroplastic n=1 Tax=Ceratopteris richardii TaxID=49495 RepID=A0A8T2V1S4_CERRI|nr:hypothetical protein KP509_03G088700 [Ceratopteris richardii]